MENIYSNKQPPSISQEVINQYLVRAQNSTRMRYPYVLHAAGAEHNEVFNFLIKNTYMQPHLHPGAEKIENIHIISGRLAILLFDDDGKLDQVYELDQSIREKTAIPAFTWHTYIVLTESAITYETMMGVYDPETWKKMADWAPNESAEESDIYLDTLTKQVQTVLLG